IRALYRGHHDGGGRAARFLQTAYQRPDQRHLYRAPERSRRDPGGGQGVGLVQLGITLLRLGDLTRYVSHAVIVGFTLGAGIMLVLDQLKNLVGVPAPGGPADHILKRFWLSITGGAPNGATV